MEAMYCNNCVRLIEELKAPVGDGGQHCGCHYDFNWHKTIIECKNCEKTEEFKKCLLIAFENKTSFFEPKIQIGMSEDEEEKHQEEDVFKTIIENEMGILSKEHAHLTKRIFSTQGKLNEAIRMLNSKNFERNPDFSDIPFLEERIQKLNERESNYKVRLSVNEAAQFELLTQKAMYETRRPLVKFEYREILIRENLVLKLVC
jgi:hypothetical protein